jgi:hypothetical protein
MAAIVLVLGIGIGYAVLGLPAGVFGIVLVLVIVTRLFTSTYGAVSWEPW